MEEIILVVDDNMFYGQLITHILSHNTPYHPQFVQTGSQALALARAITPILFLLDYQLPDTTGIRLYDQLHKIEGREQVPAILLSADLPNPELERQLAAREILGMSKPFHADNLLLTINLLLLKDNRKLV